MNSKFISIFIISTSILGLALLSFYRQQVEPFIGTEIFKMIIQFSLFGVLGGAISFLYRQLSVELQQRDSRKEIQRELYSQIINSFTSAKKVRWMIRANSLIYKYDEQGEHIRNHRGHKTRLVLADSYAKQMENLIDSQLQFQLFQH